MVNVVSFGFVFFAWFLDKPETQDDNPHESTTMVLQKPKKKKSKKGGGKPHGKKS
jgi:hypothetical protein